MGGKGKRRREKNYNAAHGGHSRLPPPPKPSSLDAVPSKLRKIMAFTQSGPGKVPEENVLRNGRDHDGNSADTGKLIDAHLLACNSTDTGKEHHAKGEFDSKTDGMKEKGNHGNLTTQQLDDTPKKKNRKRQRKEVNDLRFGNAKESDGVGLKRKERKKKRLQERKKKHQKLKAEDNEGFPGQEEIKFGDVVEAPPKSLTVPKELKPAQDASQARLRLEAVEAYRNRRGWTSRPGIQLPPTMITSSHEG